MSQYGSALELATSEMRGDREVVMEAVAQQGIALQFASVELQNDRANLSFEEAAERSSFITLELRDHPFDSLHP